MQVYPNRFAQHIQQQPKPVALVFGDEPQQKLECIDAMRHQAIQDGFSERQTLVADSEFDWSLLLEASQSMSLFSDKQYIELELPTGKPGATGGKTLVELASGDLTDLRILVHGPKIGKDVQNAKWFKSLNQLGSFTQCFPLEGQRLRQWIERCLQQHQLSANKDAITVLADNCEGNLLAARQEIEKLSLLYAGQQLTQDAIAKVSVDQSRFNVFQLVDTLLAGNMQRAIKMLYRLESEGVEPNIVIWALVKEWQTLATLNQAQSLGQSPNWQKLRIWQNRQALYQSALSRLSQQDLNVMRDKLADADLRFKQSVISKPYVTLCHLCLLFMPAALGDLELC
jgi:DNA polymerase-3 subunit delta